MIDKDTSIKTLFNVVIETLDELRIGEEFTVKELFRGFEWKRIPIGKRLVLGKEVLNYYLTEGGEVIKKLDKTPLEQQRYRKI